MIETFFGGVAVLTVGGLVTLSIKRPRQYKRLLPWFASLFIFVQWTVYVFGYGGFETQRVMWKFIDPSKAEEALNAARAVQPDLGITLLVGILGMVFFGALYFLPAIMGIDDDGNPLD